MPSPNLLNLSPKKLDSLAEKHHLTISAFSKISIILVQTVFAALLGLNAATVSKVKKIEIEVRAMETQLINKKASIELAEKIIDKTNMLKELQAGRTEFAPNIKRAFELIPPQVTVTQAIIKEGSLEIIIQTKTPIDAALLINAYLENGLASQITLNYANLSVITENFITNMEVLLK